MIAILLLAIAGTGRAMAETDFVTLQTEVVRAEHGLIALGVVVAAAD